MAVNKNFVVKNGLEVDTNTLFVDSANNRVAIGTTVPTASLDVRGKILSDSQVESFVGKFVGIVTAGAVGVTTMTTLDAVVTGFSTLGLANATSLNVTTGFSTVQSLTADDITVSIGATVSKDLNVGGAVSRTSDTNEDIKLLKNAPIPSGSSLEFMSGNKIVLETSDQINVDSDTNNSVDAALTIMEIT